MIPAQLQPGQRVRVNLKNKYGGHLRSFSGRVTGWDNRGLCRVLEDGKKAARAYNADNIRLIKPVPTT